MDEKHDAEEEVKGETKESKSEAKEEVKEGKEMKEVKEEKEEEKGEARGLRSRLPPGSDVAACASAFWSFYAKNPRKAHGLQHALAAAREDAKVKQVEGTFSPAALAYSKSAAMPGAVLSLSAFPVSARSVLADAHFTTALRMHVGLSPVSDMPLCCVCGVSLSDDPYHLLRCNKFRGNLVYKRHNQIAQVVRDFARAAGAGVSREQVLEDGKRIDLMVHTAGGTDMVDVSIRDPSAPALVARAVVDGGAASEKARIDKERVYGAEAKRLGCNLVTFAIDTTGALSSQARAFVEKLCRVYESQEELPDPSFRSRFLMELSAVVHRGNAECVAAGLACAREFELRRFGLRFGHRRA